ncbi:MAG: radical SAM protein [Endomicrobiia bacterium]
MSIEFSKRKNNFIEKYNYGKGIVGFDEYVLRFASSCPLGCLYCYLRDVNLQKHAPKVYTNFDELEEELENFCRKIGKDQKIYLNAGENSDSFVFEPRSGLIKFLDNFISKTKFNIKIELRTKTDNISCLENVINKDRFIISFSISPQRMIDRYEPNTASFKNRLSAMKQCQIWGFSVGFRFEPIIIQENIFEEYENIFNLAKEKGLFDDQQKIHSVGFSCLRLTRGLIKKIKESNSPWAGDLLSTEFVPCPDGKFRYFRGIRSKIYSGLIELAKKYINKDKIFLSSEPDYIWQDCDLDHKKFKLD